MFKKPRFLLAKDDLSHFKCFSIFLNFWCSQMTRKNALECTLEYVLKLSDQLGAGYRLNR